MAKFKTTNAEGEEIEVDIEITADNIPKEVRDQIVKSAQGIAYGNVDTVAQKHGYSKPEGVEKTSDWIENILKTEKEKYTTLQTELEAARAGKEPSPDVQKLQEELSTAKKISENLKKEIADSQKAYKETVLHSKIDSELSSLDIAVPSHITEAQDIKEYKDVQREVIKERILKNYEVKFDEENKAYRLLKGNEAEINSKNEIASIRDIAERDFKNWIAKPGTVDPGTGGQGKPPAGQKPNLKTFEDVTASAESKGLAIGGPEWTKYVTDTSKELGIVE